MLLSARSTLEKTIHDILTYVNLKAVSESRTDSVLNLPSRTQYQKKCVPYFITSFSIVATMLLIMVRPNITLRFVSEHMGIFALTGKNIKSTKNSALHDHMLVCNNIVTFLFWLMEPMISENCKKVFY